MNAELREWKNIVREIWVSECLAKTCNNIIVSCPICPILIPTVPRLSLSLLIYDEISTVPIYQFELRFLWLPILNIKHISEEMVGRIHIRPYFKSRRQCLKTASVNEYRKSVFLKAILTFIDNFLQREN